MFYSNSNTMKKLIHSDRSTTICVYKLAVLCDCTPRVVGANPATQPDGFFSLSL